MQKQIAYSEQKKNRIATWFEAAYQGLLQAPITLMLLVTDNCIARCNMCTKWKMKDKNDLDYLTFKSLMLACQEHGTQSIFLSGGDPLVWKHWDRFLGDKEITLPLQVITPFLVSEKQKEELYKFSRVKWLRVSIDAWDEELYCKIRGVKPERVTRMKKALMELAGSGMAENIRVATVLSRDNTQQLGNIGVFCQDIGIKSWIVQPIFYYPEKSLTEKEIRTVGSNLMSHFGDSIPENNFDILMSNEKKCKSVPCIIPKLEAFVDTQLRIWPCCNIALDGHGDDYPKVEELMLGQFHSGWQAGGEFLHLWQARRNLLDCYDYFTEVNEICEQTCRFKYYFYNIAYDRLKQAREEIYI